MFPVGPTSCVSSNCLGHKIWGYKPIYLERGRKPPLEIRLRKICTFDINLYTSRGDGNHKSKHIEYHLVSDINLYTSRGDGNCCASVNSANALPAI